ncbi:MAG: hypothetical protein H8E86_05365 [Planctomycetes bacterium]|nr:hypothetical protein [Planctomycetota bacterium]
MKYNFIAGLICILSFANTILVADSIVQRGSIEAKTCKILSGGVDGLHVEFSGDTNSTLLPWSSVASITTDTARPALDPFLIQGDTISRAKRRFLRGDLVLAQPAFASLFRELIGTSSVDSRIVAEGLLRCYVATGNLREALHPWLETVRLDELGVLSPYMELVPILDESTKLCANLPPVWTSDSYTRSILDSYSKSKMQTTSSIAKLLKTKGTDNDRYPVMGVADSEFLLHIVAVASGESSTNLQTINPSEETLRWKRTWKDYFAALQMLQQKDKTTKTQAMLLLSRISAQDQNVVPWISGAAMLQLAQELHDVGLAEESRRIRMEMRSAFPTHPLLHKHVSNEGL